MRLGDEVLFLCDINNTLDVPLKFANEAIDGEMCILPACSHTRVRAVIT